MLSLLRSDLSWHLQREALPMWRGSRGHCCPWGGGQWQTSAVQSYHPGPLLLNTAVPHSLIRPSCFQHIRIKTTSDPHSRRASGLLWGAHGFLRSQPNKCTQSASSSAKESDQGLGLNTPAPEVRQASITARHVGSGILKVATIGHTF